MKFSIIVPHYDGVISDKVLCEGMDSLSQQTYKNFEVLLYHDGPTSRPLPKFGGYNLDIKIKETKKRYNNWGHSLRDLGIREATGDFIVHFNPDNLLYDYALQQMVDTRERYKNEEAHIALERLFLERGAQKDCSSVYDVIVNPCHMQGCVRFPGGAIHRTWNKDDMLLLDGFPVQPYNIDCMQLVASRKIWLAIGGWYDKSEASDGPILSRIYNEFGGMYTQEAMGVHR